MWVEGLPWETTAGQVGRGSRPSKEPHTVSRIFRKAMGWPLLSLIPDRPLLSLEIKESQGEPREAHIPPGASESQVESLQTPKSSQSWLWPHR